MAIVIGDEITIKIHEPARIALQKSGNKTAIIKNISKTAINIIIII